MEDLDQITDEELEGKDPTDAVRDRSFNPWRYAATDKARAIVAEAIGMVEAFEDHRAPRKRARKVADQKTFELTIEAVLCDLMNHALIGFPKGVFITRSGGILSCQDRYKAPALNKKLPDFLDKLEKPELAFITQRTGEWSRTGSGERTVMKPGWRLLDRMAEAKLTVADLGERPHGEVIYLREPKSNPLVRPKLIEYSDTPETELYRQQMRRINNWLVAADIVFETTMLTGRQIAADSRQRMLWRSFTRNSFDSGGRLFGGFWIPLNKKQREASIFIDGEELVELDYAQTAPRLVYARKQMRPPEKDLYRVPGYERERAGVKKVMNSMLFAQKPITRMPRGVKKKFEERYRIGDVTEAIMAYHPDIADLFHVGIGHEAQFTESQIMVDILLKLIDLEIVALPIHDAILVASSNREKAKQVMLDVFRSHTGTEGVVD
ncbi:hypothetical protein NKI56_03945 [Mesorhizobium sp. M0622]|uniref:hypothetical protein n=1 Tax=Mesorhizobium sp. M0622 TaxID=2956975 RepID=UPI00333DE7B8